MPNAGAAAIVSCFDNDQPDNDSQAIDAVSGLYTSGSTPKRRYNVLLILVEVEFQQASYSCIVFDHGNRAIDVIVCRLSIFGGRVE